MPTIKIVDFTSVQSWATFKNGQTTGTKFIVLWRQFVCSGLFTPCLWGEIQRLRKCQVILNLIVSPIYREFLTKINYGGRLGRCWRISNTQTDITRWCHVTFWPRDSNTIFEGKIAQLCALVKSTISIIGNSNFEIVYFKHYIFILCGNFFRFIGTLSAKTKKKTTKNWPNQQKQKSQQPPPTTVWINTHHDV